MLLPILLLKIAFMQNYRVCVCGDVGEGLIRKISNDVDDVVNYFLICRGKFLMKCS